jgi:hypothetical protein
VKSKDNKKINFKEESLLSKTIDPHLVKKLAGFIDTPIFISVFTICYLLRTSSLNKRW